MKLRITAIGLLAAALLTLPVSAQSERALNRTIQLTFDDTTATVSYTHLTLPTIRLV